MSIIAYVKASISNQSVLASEDLFYYPSDFYLRHSEKTNTEICCFTSGICRGYYTVARRYEFYARVEIILFLQQEHKFHIFELTCNVLFLINTDWWRRFWRFSEDFRSLTEDFRRFRKTSSKFTRTLSNIFTKISEADSLRLPKAFEEDRRCFDHTPRNKVRDRLNISEMIYAFTSEYMEKSISSPGCGFVWRRG